MELGRSPSGNGGETLRQWVVDVESLLAGDASADVAPWRKHSIYRVPPHIKNGNGRAYAPVVVSLGPFHHGEPDLLPMEMHKRQGLLHLP
uniref:Uncharacterized protein n=1 Tax=Leersia perrieri TaxID=77586 RepID=A0A0D9WPJ2_9ORYZ